MPLKCLCFDLVGASPSGKAAAFDAAMRRFESCRPSQIIPMTLLDFTRFKSQFDILCGPVSLNVLDHKMLKYCFFITLILGFMTQSCFCAPKTRPLPRFAALNTTPVNARTGPGKGYPILHILHWNKMPIKIIAEHDTWRKITGPDSVLLGWVHQNLLTSRPYVQNLVPAAALKKRPNDNAENVARVEENAIGLSKKAKNGWIEVHFKEASGWLKESSTWGLPEKPQS